jgi:prepilin-type N-terminal cleavage/methylation domain-containing protein
MSADAPKRERPSLSWRERVSRPGFTLMELIVAVVASAALLAGLGSVMLIARQIAYTPAASVHRLQAAEVFDELADELRFATYVTERSAGAIEFVVADRSGDGVPELIRYAWSGTAGDPLTKTVNDGTPAVVLDAVQQLQFTYTVDTDTTAIATTSQTAEVLLATNPNTPSTQTRTITASSWSAQQINPATFVSPPPTGTLWWTPTRVQFVCKSLAATDTDQLNIQIRSAGEPNGGPTSSVLYQATTREHDLPAAFGWFNAPLSGSAKLRLHRKYALVWAGITAPSCLLVCDTNASSGVLESEDVGGSWQLLPKQVFYRLYGTYTTPGPDIEVPRSLLASVRVTLQVGAQHYSRLETSIPLANRPEVLAAYWRTDFDHDPTSDDVNGDDTNDWQASDTAASEVANPAPYAPDSLVGGIWHSSGKLTTRPLNDFAATTIAEVAFRDTLPGGSGAMMQINADWSAGQYSPLLLRAQMASNGTQTLRLTSIPSGAAEVVVYEQTGLSSDVIRCRLTILPNDNLVNIRINNEDQGTYAYSSYNATGSDRAVSLFGDTGEAEFDYAEVRVLEAE